MFTLYIFIYFELINLIERLTSPLIGLYCYNIAPYNMDTFCMVNYSVLNMIIYLVYFFFIKRTWIYIYNILSLHQFDQENQLDQWLSICNLEKMFGLNYKNLLIWIVVRDFYLKKIRNLGGPDLTTLFTISDKDTGNIHSNCNLK